MYIPFILRMHRIMGANRREPCSCGHFHFSKEVITNPNYVEAALWAIEKKLRLLNLEKRAELVWQEGYIHEPTE